MDPKPAVIDEVPFEESDFVDVRETPFAGSNFFDHGFGSHLSEEEDEADWTDDDDGSGHPHYHGEPDCRPQ